MKKSIDPVEKLENLKGECERITRYLVGSSPSSELVERYIEANKVHFGGKNPDPEEALVDFVRRHPWSLPYLDATLGLVRPGSLLRGKIFLMVAILEATTQFTEYFLPERFSPPLFFWRSLRYGVSSAFRCLIGGVIYPFAVKTK